MLKKPVKYVDYNGQEREEDCFFNLTRAEVTEMELGVDGGLTEMIQKIVKEKNGPAIVKIFKDLILKAYGIKSPDGRRFIKSKEISEEFQQTEAYSIIFMELATDEKAAEAFINGLVDGIDVSQEAKKALPSNN